MVENDLGYALYVSVERSKVAVSAAPRTTFAFDGPSVHIDVPLTRDAFEGWIAAQLTSVGACLDRLLETAGVRAADVDAVFMTGGSALVPAVQRILVARFGEQRMRSGDFLVSVASGLARRAAH
ncbi:MAG: Hsp70 family protein [Acidobacteriota bacterium]